MGFLDFAQNDNRDEVFFDYNVPQAETLLKTIYNYEL